jgi:hypothetical protein
MQHSKCKDKKEVKVASLCTLIYVLPVSRSAFAEVGPATTALQSLSILPNLVGMPFINLIPFPHASALVQITAIKCLWNPKVE